MTKLGPISLNLWSIKEQLTTLESAGNALRILAQIGYDAVELCSTPDMLDPITLAKLCQQEGLAISGLHDIDVLQSPEASLKIAQAVNSPFVTYPYPADRDLSDRSQVSQLANDLNRVGQYLSDAEKVLSYHNHDIEFRLNEGTSVFEQLIAETDPRYLQFQLDLYWVYAAGEDPLHWCRKLTARLPQLHLKDYTLNAAGEPRSCPLGAGVLDWRAILDFVDSPQLIIEQENYSSATPFDDLALSIHFLQNS